MRFEVNAGVILVSVCGEDILVSSENINILNETGAYLFRQIMKKNTEEEIINQAKSIYDTGLTDDLDHDLKSFTASLCRLNYITKIK